MNEIDEIRQEMARIRHDLHQDVAGVVVGATDVMDWRSYLRAHPWATAGIAFVIGYLLVPKRSKPPEIVAITSSVPPGTINGFATNPDVSPPRQRGLLSPWKLMGWAMSFAGPIALNAAQAYASVWLENQLGIKPGATDRQGTDNPRNRGNGPGPEGRPGFSASGSRIGRGDRGL